MAAARIVDLDRRRLVAIAAALPALSLVPVALAQEVDLDTPFVVTPDNVVNAMLDLAKVGAGDRLIDLGSGDGRIVIAAAQRGAVARGVEIDPRLVELSRERARKAGLAARATFSTEDLFETDFSKADVVSMYLLPDVNAKLAPRLFATLRPGARIVSHDYPLGAWPYDDRIVVDAPGKTVNVDKRSALMLWIVPARIGGHWEGTAGRMAVSLDLTQDWQRVEGVVKLGRNERRFGATGVSGRDLRLDLQGAELSLHLDPARDELVGELKAGGASPAAPVRLKRA